MAILWALVGLLAGSLLNLVIHSLLRMEKEAEPVESFVPPAVRPWQCQSALLYAIFGRSLPHSVCGAGPGRIAAGVEIATALAFLLLFLRFGFQTRLIAASLYTCVLVVVFVVDWRRHLIYRIVIYPSTILALFLTPLAFEMPFYAGILGLAVGGLVFGTPVRPRPSDLPEGGHGQGRCGPGDAAGSDDGLSGYRGGVAGYQRGRRIDGHRSAGRRAVQQAAYMPYGTAMCLGTFITFFLNVPRPLAASSESPWT